MMEYFLHYSMSIPFIKPVLQAYCTLSSHLYTQFLVDCSSLPLVVSTTQMFGPQTLHHLFKVTRTAVYSLHRARMQMLGRWDPAFSRTKHPERLRGLNGGRGLSATPDQQPETAMTLGQAGGGLGSAFGPPDDCWWPARLSAGNLAACGDSGGTVAGDSDQGV